MLYFLCPISLGTYVWEPMGVLCVGVQSFRYSNVDVHAAVGFVGKTKAQIKLMKKSKTKVRLLYIYTKIA